MTSQEHFANFGEQGGPRQKRSKGGGGSFTSRMEDRFRRRFDE